MKHVGVVVRRLRKHYGLDFSSRESDPFRVLITTIISQRNRDESTDVASQKLFSRFRTVKSLASADVRDVESVLRSIGLYRQKAKRIVAVSKIIHVQYADKVPADISKLVELPGVGRKTANCVLVYGFRLPAIPVDTHVHRISNRLGWVKTKTPEQTEQQLVKIVPRKYWIEINELLVKHGQGICRPLNPRCMVCPVKGYCSYYRHFVVRNL